MTTFVCIASGPSLSKAQINCIARSHAKGDVKVIAVSDNYQIAPWADYVYSCDFTWWNEYYNDVVEFTKSELVTSDRTATSIMRVKKNGKRSFTTFNVEHRNGINPDEGSINHGGNSGHQAIQVAHKLGATKIVLVGYDMQHTGGKKHWFGDHPAKFTRNADKPNLWLVSVRKLLKELEEVGVEVINSTIETAIPESYAKQQTLEYTLYK